MMRGLFLAGALLAAPAMAQTPPQTWPPAGVSYYGDPSVPDVSGMWLGSVMGVPGKGAQTNSGQSADGRPPVFWAPWPLPYTSAYQKISDEREAATRKGVALGDTGSRCLPFGLPMMLATKNYPDEIVQTPGVTTIFMNSTFPIMIWTDGRPHPADWTPSYNGHSIGHWEGDTLYVDTVGIRGETPMDGMRNPHSPKLHIKWSLRHVAQDVLHMQLTLYDEDAFTEPVAMTTIWHRQSDPKWQILDDGSCFENNSLLSDKPPQEGFIKF